MPIVDLAARSSSLAELASHLIPAHEIERRERRGRLSSGLPALDGWLGGGWPRGALSELCGPRSSGRNALLMQALRAALAAGEVTALIDVQGGLDAQTARNGGVPLERLLWVRCTAGQALPAAELVLNAGGVGLVGIDFGDGPSRAQPGAGPRPRRTQVTQVPTAAWLRLKRGAEQQGSVVLLSGPQRPQGAQSRCALTLGPARPCFATARPNAAVGPPLLLGLRVQVHMERSPTGTACPAPLSLELWHDR